MRRSSCKDRVILKLDRISNLLNIFADILTAGFRNMTSNLIRVNGLNCF